MSDEAAGTEDAPGASGQAERRPTDPDRLAVVRQDNGELVEDVVTSEDRPDTSGGARRDRPGDERVVQSEPMPEAPEGPRPGSRRPGTLPQRPAGERGR